MPWVNIQALSLIGFFVVGVVSDLTIGELLNQSPRKNRLSWRNWNMLASTVLE